MNDKNRFHDDTLCQSENGVDSKGFESLSTPVYRASTLIFPTVKAYQKRRENLYDGYSYGHYGTPTTKELEQKITTLEQGARTVLTPSGMSAIALISLVCAKPGQKILFPDTVYDTARTFAEKFLAEFGIRSHFYDPSVGERIAELIDANVALIWVESPGSFTLEIQDLPAIASSARRYGVKIAADNTWATPLRCRPLELGADFSVNSLSKYFSGHSDVVMGSISVRDDDLYKKLKDYCRYLGYGVHADAASLVLRGIKTMAVRVDRSEATATMLAEMVSQWDCVDKVYYPPFATTPGHALWRRDFKGATGLFSFVLNPDSADRLDEGIEAMRHIKIGSSWGGTQSVVAVPNQFPARENGRPEPGWPIIRLSVGLESCDDLRDDLERARTIWTK